MQNKKLLKIKKLLTGYYTDFKQNNLLSISDNKESLPFAYLIDDKSYPGMILMSIAVDYPHSIRVTNVALLAATLYKIQLSDEYFISTTNGMTHFNENAYSQWDLESINLTNVQPISDQIN